MVEDDLQWKTTFVGRQPSVDDDILWRTTFGGRQPLVEDNLWWKMTFGGIQPAMEDDLQWKITFIGSLHTAYSALRHFFVVEILRVKLMPINLFYGNNLLNAYCLS